MLVGLGVGVGAGVEVGAGVGVACGVGDGCGVAVGSGIAVGTGAGSLLHAEAKITSATIATTTLKEASMRGDSTTIYQFVTRQRVS